MTEQERIDRMIDGAMSTEDQQRFLRQCESRNSWRKLALAFVEAQAISKEFKLLLKRELPLGTVAPERNKLPASPTWFASTSGQLWWISAALLLALGLGFGLGWWVDQDGKETTGAEFADLGFDRTDHSAQEKGDLDSFLFTQFDPSSHELKQFNVPIVQASDLGSDWQRRLPSTVSDDYIQRLRTQGVDVRQQRLFMPVRTPSGRRIVVPIDYVNFEQLTFH